MTLITSKGCVIMVAIAPDDAADKLWIPVEQAFEVGGSNCAVIAGIREKVEAEPTNVHVDVLMTSQKTTKRPAYGASRKDDAKKPRRSSDGPKRTIEANEPVKLSQAYILLCEAIA